MPKKLNNLSHVRYKSNKVTIFWLSQPSEIYFRFIFKISLRYFDVKTHEQFFSGELIYTILLKTHLSA